MTGNGNPTIGGIRPLAFGIEPISGLHLKAFDFYIEVFTETGCGKTQKIEQKDMTFIDDDTVKFFVDTKVVGTGTYYARVTMEIPDKDAPGGKWPEKLTFETDLTINAR